MSTFHLVLWTAILCPSSTLLCQGTADKPDAHDVAGSTYTPHMSFDVASIRESGGGNYSGIDDEPRNSFYHADRVSVWALIFYAYDVDLMSRLKNVPVWAEETKYDVTAKSDAATDATLAKLSDKNSYAEKDFMMRALLADRFKLQIHMETRQSTIYELVATARTAKLMTPVHRDLSKTISTCNLVPSRAGMEMDSKGCPYSMLLGYLQQVLDATIVDHTGLSGMYTFHVMYGWQRPREGVESYPPALDAIREQLGLEVKKTQGPATFWVVDHIERPTPN
jgi:uncharacterized protein (TIGR03435 family)